MKSALLILSRLVPSVLLSSGQVLHQKDSHVELREENFVEINGLLSLCWSGGGDTILSGREVSWWGRWRRSFVSVVQLWWIEKG